MKTVYHHEARECVCCGDFGEHPIRFIAWIEYNGPETRETVMITRATLVWTFGDFVKEEDVTVRINAIPWLRDKYAEEILESYNRAREREYEGDDDHAA